MTSNKNDNRDYLDLIREDIRMLSAYKVQEAGDLIKLDAMENPFELPEVIRKAWMEKASRLAINRYPDPKAIQLKQKLRAFLSLDQAYDILFGNGSDEIIQLLMLALAKPHAKVMSVEPSFVMYKIIANLCGLRYIGVDLNKDFSLNFEDLKSNLISEKPALFFLAQPNNPTGNLFSIDDIEQLISLSDGLVVIDEAYTAFANYDAQYLLDKFDNVLVLRTFSKTGLAGARLGYLLGKRTLLNEFDKVRMPYNINSMTQLLLECVIDNYDALQEQSRMLISLREDLCQQLSMLPDVQVFPSQANFILLRVLEKDAKAIAESLREKGILIKVLDGGHSLLKDCLRITVGTSDENKQFVNNLEKLLK